MHLLLAFLALACFVASAALWWAMPNNPLPIGMLGFSLVFVVALALTHPHGNETEAPRKKLTVDADEHGLKVIRKDGTEG